MDDEIDTAKGTARSAEFSATKPLPPIGTSKDEIDLEGAVRRSDSACTDRSDHVYQDDDQRSTVSSAAFDRPGEGSARPRIIRNFRPEMMSDEEKEQVEAHRSVAFTNGPPVTSKHRTYDGREITLVTLNTQTDWDWVENVEITGTAKSIIPGEDKPGSAGKERTATSPRSASSRPDKSEDKMTPDISQYHMPYNDEYGIPILDLSSDTDDSSDDEVSHKKIKDDRMFMPSVGPPNILQIVPGLQSGPSVARSAHCRLSVRRASSKSQYQRESEKHDIPVDDPETRLPDFDKDEAGMTHGMFSGCCEFCSKPVKSFPTLEQQLKCAPETLYCCTEYREFVEFVLSTSNQMEEEQKKKNKLIDIKPHEHVGSKQERNDAKEKAVQRMRERELQRRQQEASGLQQNFFAYGPGDTSNEGFMKIPNGLGNITMKDMFGTPQAPQAFPKVLGIPGGNTDTSGGSPRRFLESGGAFARQMKTINYQLSSQKCLEEGWTLRAPSPLLDDVGDDVFIPEPLNPAMIEEGKLRDRPLIEKYYESGKKFLTMFPDGTGNVFYPSGNLAILISSVKLGQYYYTIHQDIKRSAVAAAFEPNGYGYCYFPNGDIRLYIDQYGGIELDNYGARRRKWSWKDQVTHVHAPPFQPICIGINRHIGVRVMSQDNIALTFSASKRSCRFNMGSRLKLVAPENAPLKEVEEEYIFLEEKKNHVDALLNKVANLLKFPNNPKLDKMLPPLHVTSKQTKTEKLKKERQIFLAQQSEREKKQPSITAIS